jgi:hypothetical protein
MNKLTIVLILLLVGCFGETTYEENKYVIAAREYRLKVDSMAHKAKMDSIHKITLDTIKASHNKAELRISQ